VNQLIIRKSNVQSGSKRIPEQHPKKERLENTAPLKAEKVFFDNRKKLITKIEIIDLQYADTIAKKNYLVLLLELLNIPWKEYSILNKHQKKGNLM